MMDFGRISTLHIEMIIKCMLMVRGETARIYPPEVFDNDYQTVYPELIPDSGIHPTCKVLLGQPMEGLSVSDYIRLNDVTKEIPLVTNAQLEIGTRLVVTMQDGKTLNLRIIERNSTHASTSQSYKYVAVMS